MRLEAPRVERGAAVIEFALVLPLLLAIAIGIIYYGYAFVLKSAVENASRAGAEQAVAVSPLVGEDYAAARDVRVREAIARSLEWLPDNVSEAIQIQIDVDCMNESDYGVRVTLPLIGSENEVLPSVELGGFRIPPIPLSLHSLACVVI